MELIIFAFGVMLTFVLMAFVAPLGNPWVLIIAFVAGSIGTAHACWVYSNHSDE
jgi:membrane protein implicated in regulation of membrane protease activity